VNWYIHVLKNYANFNGRASRKEYWFFVLFNAIFAIAAMILDNLLGLAIQDVGYGPLYIVYVLATLVPGIAVSVRRLHDIGKSGWYFLLAFIPCVGGIILLIFDLTPGDTGDNEFGPDPYAFSETYR
jgi:uncharacterized membrane protein YhaH (DUF805 family)